MSASITAIGEILWDVYPDQKRLGGAPFNFIYHIFKIIGNANFISSVGNDEYGNEILTFLRSIGFDTRTIDVNEHYPTGTVKVELDKNKAPCFTISSECSFDHLLLNKTSLNVFQNETDILYFGTFTTRKGTSRDTVLSLLNHPGKKYFCDLNLRHDFYTKEFIEKTLTTCNVIKLNEYELAKLRDFFALPESNTSAIEKIMDEFNIDLVGLTLGADGAELYRKNEKDVYKMSSCQIIDTLGAGDAFAAILCLGYLKNLPLHEINKLANEFALDICMVNGALPKEDKIYLKYKNVFS